MKAHRGVLVLIGVVLCSATLTWADTATMTLNWAAASNATAYKVMKKVGSGAYALLGAVNAPAVTFTDAGNAMGQTYCYQIVASNTSGDAGPSPEQCVMPTVIPTSVGTLNISVTIVPSVNVP